MRRTRTSTHLANDLRFSGGPCKLGQEVAEENNRTRYNHPHRGRGRRLQSAGRPLQAFVRRGVLDLMDFQQEDNPHDSGLCDEHERELDVDERHRAPVATAEAGQDRSALAAPWTPTLPA
jgi:hypothetical protein